jgi:lysocardiolipin and lysophospholipid acyltransferase
LPKLEASLKAIVDNHHPRPVWVGMYPEGTRITDAKRAESWSFAEKNGLPRLNNVLLPRTKGFTFITEKVRPVLDCIYDVTIAYKGGPAYIRHALTDGVFQTSAVHMHVQRIPVADLPQGEPALKQWLLERFKQKDALLAHFHEHQNFPGSRNFCPPATTRLINTYFAWAMLILSPLSAFAPKWLWVSAWLLAFVVMLRSFTNSSMILQSSKADLYYRDASAVKAESSSSSDAPATAAISAEASTVAGTTDSSTIHQRKRGGQ